jgi:hypothetical protein
MPMVFIHLVGFLETKHNSGSTKKVTASEKKQREGVKGGCKCLGWELEGTQRNAD